MRIKIANTGKRPWNLGVRWSPETIQNIREKTVEAMQRKDVAENYRRSMHVFAAMTHAAYRKRKLKKASEKEARLKRQREARQSKPKKKRRRVIPKKPKAPSPQQYHSRAPKSTEQRQRISDSVKQRWMDPEFREKVASGRRKRSSQASSTKNLPSDQVKQSVSLPRKTQRSASNKDAINVSREKYTTLMATVAQLAEDISALEVQRTLVASNAEAVEEIDAALERARKLIETVREAVKRVERQLGIQTSPLDAPSEQAYLNNGYEADSDSE